jgi:hypothetical protein
MSDPNDNPRVVTLSAPDVPTQSVQALSEPRVIFEHRGKHYVTLACWEYDSANPELTPDQRAGTKQVLSIFDRSATVDARLIAEDDSDVFCAACGPGALPPPPTPTPTRPENAF